MLVLKVFASLIGPLPVVHGECLVEGRYQLRLDVAPISRDAVQIYT